MSEVPTGQQSDKPRSPRSSCLVVGMSLLALGLFTVVASVLMIEARESTRKEARRNSSMNNALNIVLAQKNFASLSNGAFATPTLVNEQGEPVHGWFTQLLPLLDQQALYENIDLSVPWNHPDNQEYSRIMMQVAWNPGIDEQQNEDGYPLLHYTLNERMFPNNESLKEDYISRADGLGNTILLGEIEQGLPAWGAPGNARDPARGLRPGPNTMGVSVWGGATVIGFADGRVRVINNDIDPSVLKTLSTPDGGEDVPEDY